MAQSNVKLSLLMWRDSFVRYASQGQNLQNQIRTMIVDAILDGRLPVGSEVPSSRELSEALGVARNTVVLAYQQLVSKGYLITRDRSAHLVNPEMVKPGVGDKPVSEKTSLPEGGYRTGSPNWARRIRSPLGIQRNIVKRADWQKIPYPFLYGQFDSSLFPTAEWRECCMKALSVSDIREWAQDLISHDDERLVQEICSKVLPRRGVWAKPNEVVITVGAQHALFMIADLLVGPKSCIAFEDPCYPDARNIFSLRAGKIIPIPVDSEGLVLSTDLAKAEMVIVTPSHQCPTTVKMSMARRQALLDFSEKNDLVVVEDDYEAESSFSEDPSPALKSIDRSGRVLYVGSLSKTFAPGLRLGYIVGPTELIHELRGLRRLMVRHPSAFIQRAFAMFISLGHLDAMVKRQTHAFRQRSEELQNSLRQNIPDLQVIPGFAGSSLWVKGPPGFNSKDFAKRLECEGVLIEPGDVFFHDPSKVGFFRMGFSSINSVRITEGVKVMARIFYSEFCERRPGV